MADQRSALAATGVPSQLASLCLGGTLRRRAVGSAPSSGTPQSAPTRSGPRPHLLWIEDHPQLMAPLMSYLVKEGFDVEFATSGDSGVRLAKSARHEVILLDLKLPDLPGIEVLKTLRSGGIGTPIIVITGFGSLDSAVEMVRAGAAHYKAKPLRAVELLQTIRSVIDSANRQVITPAIDVADRFTDGASGSCAHWPTAPRAARLARVLADACSAPNDFRSVDELCRVTSLGVAPGTFRRWCDAESIHPREAVDFARLLRAVVLAERHGAEVSEWLDVDPRTFCALLNRGGVTELFDRAVPGRWEFMNRQRFVRNPHVLNLVRRARLGQL